MSRKLKTHWTAKKMLAPELELPDALGLSGRKIAVGIVGSNEAETEWLCYIDSMVGLPCDHDIMKLKTSEWKKGESSVFRTGTTLHQGLWLTPAAILALRELIDVLVDEVELREVPNSTAHHKRRTSDTQE